MKDDGIRGLKRQLDDVYHPVDEPVYAIPLIPILDAVSLCPDNVKAW